MHRVHVGLHFLVLLARTDPLFLPQHPIPILTNFLPRPLVSGQVPTCVGGLGVRIVAESSLDKLSKEDLGPSRLSERMHSFSI